VRCPSTWQMRLRIVAGAGGLGGGGGAGARGARAGAAGGGGGGAPDEPFGKYLPIARPGLFRLGEIVGEVGADKLLSRHASGLDGRLVHIGDLPSALMVTSGSSDDSIRVRAYCDACFWSVTSRAAATLPLRCPLRPGTHWRCRVRR